MSFIAAQWAFCPGCTRLTAIDPRSVSVRCSECFQEAVPGIIVRDEAARVVRSDGDYLLAQEGIAAARQRRFQAQERMEETDPVEQKRVPELKAVLGEGEA